MNCLVITMLRIHQGPIMSSMHKDKWPEKHLAWQSPAGRIVRFGFACGALVATRNIFLLWVPIVALSVPAIPTASGQVKKRTDEASS